MARGWESKSVEAQQAEASERSSQSHRKQLSPEEIALARRQALLQLSRKQVIRQLEAASNPKQRSMLEAALADLERQINASELRS